MSQILMNRFRQTEIIPIQNQKKICLMLKLSNTVVARCYLLFFEASMTDLSNMVKLSYLNYFSF